MTEKEILDEQRKVWEWMFDMNEKVLEERGYKINEDTGKRCLVIDLSSNSSK